MTEDEIVDVIRGFLESGPPLRYSDAVQLMYSLDPTQRSLVVEKLKELPPDWRGFYRALVVKFRDA